MVFTQGIEYLKKPAVHDYFVANGVTGSMHIPCVDAVSDTNTKHITFVVNIAPSLQRLRLFSRGFDFVQLLVQNDKSNVNKKIR